MMAYSLTSEEISGIEDIFFKLDPNKTGEISLQEFFEVLKTHLVISNDEVERLFAVMDSNQRGKLSYTEFVAAMLQTRVQMNEDVIRESFDRLDKEHKGTISKTDLRNALGGQSFDGMDVEQLFTECGVVGETIDYETFNKMMVSKFERDGKANVAGTKSVDTWNKSAKRKNSAGRNSLSLQDGQTRSFGANTFTANSPEMLEFEATLRKHGIDVSEFGKGEAKSIGDLFWEVQKSECVMGLHKGEFKRMLRVLRLALWVVTPSGEKRVLMEGDQQLQDGRIREGRNKRVAKKMSVGEFWKDALARALFSELSLEQEFQNQHLEFLEQIEVDNERYAKGYPGLKTVYQFCDVSMRVKDPAHADCTKLGLPNCEDFVTEEMSMLGTDRRHFWTWQTEAELKVLMQKEAEERQKYLAENAARLGGDLQRQKTPLYRSSWVIDPEWLPVKTKETLKLKLACKWVQFNPFSSNSK
jgi:Ca2+-binding EF-hand superfamily protein